MARTEHYHTILEPGSFYHIYNRTVDRKPMFKNAGNYEFFLRRYSQYLSPVLDTYAYCLLGNHFHLLVGVRSWADLTMFVQSGLSQPGSSTHSPSDLTTFEKLSNLKTGKTPHDIVSHQFRKFFQSYAMAFNKQHDRVGTLFQTPFKRALVDSDGYFAQLVYYIHANPLLHGLTDDYTTWTWSSYGSILSDKQTKLKKQEVLNWFGGGDNYLAYHAQNTTVPLHEKYVLDDAV